MSEEQNDKVTLTRKPLGLKRAVESGEVKQTFSHGRTNKVVVEVKRRKLVGRPGAAPEAVEAPTPAPPPPVVQQVIPPPPQVRRPADDMLSRQERQTKLLREAEEARLTSLEDAHRREENVRQARSADTRAALTDRGAGNEESSVPPEAALVEQEATAPDALVADSEVPAIAEAESAAGPAARRFTPVEAPKRAAREKERAAPAKPARGVADRRQSGKLSVTRALSDDDGARARSLAALKRAREKEKRSQMSGLRRDAQPKQVREVQVPEAITVQELANRMAEKGSDLVKALFNMGSPVTITQTIDQDTAELLIEEFGHRMRRVSESDVEIDTHDDADDAGNMQTRPPVVTVMGHVDHGKTSLLDALRGENVVAGEAGGITQHIGAYQVTTKRGDVVTFLDTPGHEAFTEMRARGANVTDIVILVVAADDGLMPQTVEAINHAKAAHVPIIVAINKMDKDDANPKRVRDRLLEHELIVESLGGDTQEVEVSALKKTGLDELLDKLASQAELMELTANPDRDAEAVVVEAKLDKGRGPVATLLVKRGTLRRGDTFVVGEQSGKVRALIDDRGNQIDEAFPSQPVELLGLSGVPHAGDLLTVVENEARAREVAAYRADLARKKRTAMAPASLDTMFSAKESKTITFPVVIKGDVQGSTEAIVNALHKLSTPDIVVRVLHSGVGGITESDVMLAHASGAPVIGFNTRSNAKAREIAEREKVRMKYFDVIYHLTEDIAKEMAGELGPEIVETIVGRAEIKEVFPAGKHGKAAGILVTEGVLRKALKARITREDVIIYNGEIASLRRFKDDVAEVRSGLECGVTFTDFKDIKPGDYLETFEVEERERIL